MEPYLLTSLGRAQAFVEVAVLPICTPTTTRDGLLNGLQHAIYHTLIQNVTKMAARGRKDGGDLVMADKLERLVAAPPARTKAEEGSPQHKKKAVVPDVAHTQVPYLKQRCVSPNTKRARDEEDLSLTGVLRQEVFFSEFTRQWHAPLVGSNASPSATSKQGPNNGADPADVVRASDSAHTKWGSSPVFDALKGSLSPSDAQTLLRAYRFATHTTTAAAVSMGGSQPTPATLSTCNVQDTAILALERYMVLDGLSTFLACGCKESPAFYKAHLDLTQTWDLSAALALNIRIACRCGVPETVVHAALHTNEVPTTTTGASAAAVPSPPSGSTTGALAIIDDAVAMNRWRVEVVGEFLLELIFPLPPTSPPPSQPQGWLQLFIQRCMPEDVIDDDDDDMQTVNSVVATPPGIASEEADGAAQDGGGEGGLVSGLVVSPGNVMTLMGTTPHLLPKVVVQQCRKNVFSEAPHHQSGSPDGAWSADHPFFSITAWELQHHYTMAELNKLHAKLKDASKGKWGADPPPKVKAPMATLLFDSKEALRPYLVPQEERAHE